MSATHAIPGAQLAVFSGSSEVWREKADLAPERTYEHSLPLADKAATYRFELRDAAGKLLMTHTERLYEAVTPASAKLGLQTAPGPGARRDTPADFIAAGEIDEKASLFTSAEAEYRAGLKKFAADPQLTKALGRLLAAENRFNEALETLRWPFTALQLDPEFRYYLGLAQAETGHDDDARRSWAFSASGKEFGPASAARLACLEARAGHTDEALRLAESVPARNLRIPLLRASGRATNARKELAEALALDPIDSFLRYEAVRLGGQDDSLWAHLAAEPERVLDIAGTYLSLGLYADALEPLSHTYPAVPANQTEPGATLPQANPLISYYRAYCELKLGRDPAADLKVASSQSLEYVFPHRGSSTAVLAAALQIKPNDAAALYLTGLLELDRNQIPDAIRHLQAALAIRKDIPAIHYVLARALLLSPEGKPQAVAILKEGVALHPDDATLKSLLAGSSAPAPKPPLAAAPAAAGAKLASDPAGIAARALELTANGESVLGMFNGRDFPEERQPESVRWAYMEVQLEYLRRLAAQKNCGAALAGVDNIGAEDRYLPFTAEGFDAFLKGARFQYYLGAVEALCGQTGAARRRWSRVARMAPAVTSADFAFPAVAAQSAASKSQSPDLGPWLDQLGKAAGENSDALGMLDYSKGILLLAAGDERGALDAFSQGARQPDHDFSQYLNKLALGDAQRAARPIR